MCYYRFQVVYVFATPSWFICKTFRKIVKHLKRIRLLAKKVLEVIYFCSIVRGELTAWQCGGTCVPILPQYLERIHLMRARIIYNLPDNLSSAEILGKANWQPFANFFKRKLAALMYSIYHGNLAPTQICDLFIKSTSHYNPRRSLNFKVLRLNNSIGRYSIRYRGSTLWNILPKAYQALPNLELFKEKLKKDNYWKTSSFTVLFTCQQEHWLLLFLTFMCRSLVSYVIIEAISTS